MKKNWLCFSVILLIVVFARISYADSTANSDNANINNLGVSFSDAEQLRGFANPGGVGFPAIPSFFGPDTPGPTYQKIELILPLKSEWQRFELEPIIGDTDIMFRCRYFLKTEECSTIRVKKPRHSTARHTKTVCTPLRVEELTDTIHVITVPPKGTFRMIGHITLWSKDKYTTSLELMAKAMLLAMELPTANALLISGQGCEKKVEISGWGIFGNQTRATVNSAQNVSGVSVGGMGYSSGIAGNTGRPWLQAAIIQFAQ